MTKLQWVEPEPWLDTDASAVRGFARRFATGLVWATLAIGIAFIAVGRVVMRDAAALLLNPIAILELLRQPVALGASASIVAMLAFNAAVDEWREVSARRAEGGRPGPVDPALASAQAPALSAPSATRSRARRIWSGVQLVLVIGLAVGIFVFRPFAWGGTTSYAVVVGVSMEPTMRTGDLAVVMRQDTYAVGDIVSYHPSAAPEGEIMHRVVAGDAASGWVTKGDNRPDADPDRSTTANIVGKVVLHVPMAGFLVNSLRNPYVVGTLVAVLVMAVAWDLVAKRKR